MQAAQNQGRMSGYMDRWLNNRVIVYWCVAIFSGALSLYRYATRDIINGDGILYIDVARAFLKEGIDGAVEVYNWPFFGILIGLVHKLTGLSFENSAGFLNAIFMMIVCLVFVRIYEGISDREARFQVAAVLILALPVLNGYREFVVRGHGFWAFTLVALYYFIQYSRSPGLMTALKWQLSMAIAILFRLEGIVFLVLAPFCLLFIAEERRRMISHIIRLNGLFISLTILVPILLLASGTLTMPSSLDIPYQLHYVSPTALGGAVDAEAEMMFARNRFMSTVDDAQLILASGLLVLVAVKVLSNVGLPFLAVLAWGVRRKWLQLTRESLVVMYFAVIGFLVLVPVAGNYFFLSSRYTILTVLLVSLITFQYVDYLFRELSKRRLHKWSIAAWVFILVLFLDGVISGGASKQNIRVAGEWLKAEVGAEEKIACNEARLRFYSGDRCKWVKFADEEPSAAIKLLRDAGYAYILFWIDRRDERLRSSVDADTGLLLVKEFPNKSGNTVRLYRLEQVRR